MKYVMTNDRKLIKRLSSANPPDPQEAEEVKEDVEVDSEQAELMR